MGSSIPEMRVAHEKKDVEHLQFRSGLGPFFNILESLKTNLKSEHCDLLRGTPFWRFFKAYDDCLLSDHGNKKTYIDIIRIIQCFNVESKEFEVMGRQEKLSAVDVADIFGMPNAGEEIPIKRRMSKPESEFVDRNFKCIARVTRQNVEALLTDKVKGLMKQDQEDFVCLLCLYICVTVLFCNSGNSVGWNFVTRCESIEKLKKYNWAKATFDFLENQLVKYSGRPGSVNGCVILLLYWVCEKFSLIHAVRGRENYRPKFLKWDLQELHKAMPDGDLRVVKEVRTTLSAEGQGPQTKNGACSRLKLKARRDLVGKARTNFIKPNMPKSVGKVRNGTYTKICVQSESNPSKVYQLVSGRNCVGKVKCEDNCGNEDRTITPNSLCQQMSEYPNPCKLNQLISTEDFFFEEDASGEPNIEVKLKKYEELLDQERLQTSKLTEELRVLQGEGTKNEELKKENDKLKLDLEIAKVKVITLTEMLLEAQNYTKEADDHDAVFENSIQNLEKFHESTNKHSLVLETPPPNLGTEYSEEMKSWVVRLKRRKRRVKRMAGFIYFNGKKIKSAEGLNVIASEDETRKVSNAGTMKYGDCIKAKGKHNSLPSIDPSCMSVWMCLSEMEQNKLHMYLLSPDSGIPLWKGALSAVYSEDVKDLLTESAITTDVLDSFGEIMQNEVNTCQGKNIKAHIMSTHCWDALRNEDRGETIRFLYDPLLEVLGSVDYIFFPMRHTDGFHFTLVVFQKLEEQWLHYNSKWEGKEATMDPCYLEAKKLRVEVTRFLQYNVCIASTLLKNGYRVRQDMPSSLTNGEIQTFKWLENADPCFPLWPVSNCPQQKNYTHDCGVAVMYYLCSILKVQPLMSQFPVDAMKHMRGKVLSKFLTDKNCWDG